MSRMTGRRVGAAVAAFSVACAGAVAVLGPSGAEASSHREAPLIAADPAVDNTDVYAFVSPERPGYVTFIANFIPFEEPNGGPNFYPFATDATYNVKVDSNGDAQPDAVFRWTFHNVDKRGGNTFLYNNGPVTSLDDPNLLFRQTYTLEASFGGGPFRTRASNAPVAPSRVGPASMPDYKKLRDQAVRWGRPHAAAVPAVHFRGSRGRSRSARAGPRDTGTSASSCVPARSWGDSRWWCRSRRGSRRHRGRLCAARRRR